MTEQPGASAPTWEPESGRGADPVGAPVPGSFATSFPGSDAASAVTPAATVTPAADAPTPPRRKRRLLRWFGWSFACLGALALIGLSAYLVVVSQQWSDRVDELTVISEDLGQSVADARAAQADAEARMDIARVELENATARISDLANEEAQAKDRESVLIDYVDAMISCADGRATVIQVLTTNYVFNDGKSATTHARELDTYCDGISSDFSAFKEEIAQ